MPLKKQYICPTCQNQYVDMLEHIRKRHPNKAYTEAQMQQFGLTTCPKCHTACHSAHGVKTHLAKIHGITGGHKKAMEKRTRICDTPLEAKNNQESELAQIYQQGQEIHDFYQGQSQGQNQSQGQDQSQSQEFQEFQHLSEDIDLYNISDQDQNSDLLHSNNPEGQNRNQNSGQNSDQDLDQDSDQDSDQDWNLDQNPDQNLDQDWNSDQNSDQDWNLDQNLDQNSNQNSNQNSDQNSDQDWNLDQNSDQNSNQNSNQGWNSGQNPDQSQNSGQNSLSNSQWAGLSLPKSNQEHQDSLSSFYKRHRASSSLQSLVKTVKKPRIQAQLDLKDRQAKLKEYLKQSKATKRPRVEFSITDSLETTQITQTHPERPQIQESQHIQIQQPIQARIQPQIQAQTQPQSNLNSAHHHEALLKPILEKTSVQQLLAWSQIPIPEKRLHARHAILFMAAANRTATLYINKTTEVNLLKFLILPRVLGLAIHQNNVAGILKAYPGQVPVIPAQTTQITRNEPMQQDTAKEAIKWLKRGFIKRASNALIKPAQIAPNTEENIAKLRSKHPIGQPSPFRTQSEPIAGQFLTKEDIITSITSIHKEKAAGLSGWNRPLLDIIKGPESQTIAFLRLLADQIRQGTAPGADLLCASRLIGLGEKVRPIAIGDMIYRVAMKAILTRNYQKDMLLANQLGVNTPGGVEPAQFLLAEAIEGPNKAKYSYIASLDMTNAFNNVPRAAMAAAIGKYAPVFYRAARWAYNNPSILAIDKDNLIASSSGARQGDPISPLLFSLAFRPTLNAIKSLIGDNGTIVAYLDDLYILYKKEKDIEKVKKAFNQSVFTLNWTKSKIYSIEKARKEGIEVLGTFIGPKAKRKAYLAEKTAILANALTQLHQLPRQMALILLQSSIHLLLRHLLRQLNPEGLEKNWQIIDVKIKETITFLASRESQHSQQSQQDQYNYYTELIHLPQRDGGLGIPAHTQLANGLYNAAKTATMAQIQQIQPNWEPWPPNIKDTSLTAQEVTQKANLKAGEDLEAKISSLELNILAENASYIGRKWLGTLPTSPALEISDSEIIEALRNRLLIPIKEKEDSCNFCGSKAVIGHQDYCRAAIRHWTVRHNQINRAFIKTLASRPDLSVEAEPKATNDSQKRTDFSISHNFKRHYYDVQIVAVNKDSSRIEALATLKEAADAKKKKYSYLGTSFSPIIISAGGLMEKDTAQTYKELQKLIGPIASSYLDSVISLVLMKTRAIAAASIAKVRPRSLL